MTERDERRPAGGPPPQAQRPAQSSGDRGRPLPRIPDVRLHRQIARGGMGVVFRGRQEFLDRDVAVKLLSPHLQGPQFVARFRREAKILAGIKHPHIVACHTAGTTSAGQSYLVMEFIDGPNLKTWISEKGALPVTVALRLTRQLASALAHASELGVIHRDVKPENILLESPTSTSVDLAFPYVPKLVDLGLARMTTEIGEVGLTAPGAVMGTPASMAPEQFDAPDSVDFRADIYGLGCVLYEMLTGVAAYQGTQLTDLVIAKRRSPAPNPSEQSDAVPPGVGELVSSMLACKREDRPSSYRELIERLDDLQADTARQTLPAPRRSAAPAGGNAPALLQTAEFDFLSEGSDVSAVSDGRLAGFPDPTVVAPPMPPRRRRSMLWGIVATVLVLLAAGVVAFQQLGGGWIRRWLPPPPVTADRTPNRGQVPGGAKRDGARNGDPRRGEAKRGEPRRGHGGRGERRRGDSGRNPVTSEGGRPGGGKPDTGEPVQPGTAKPDPVKPDVPEAAGGTAETARGTPVAKPEVAKPEVAKPEVAKPRGEGPGVAKTDGSKSTSENPRTGKPDATKSEAPDPPPVPKQNAEKPPVPKPDPEKPGTGQPRSDGPDRGEPDVTRPDVTRPDGARPDGATPDVTRPDGARPDLTRGDGSKPASDAPQTEKTRPATRAVAIRGLEGVLRPNVALELKADAPFPDQRDLRYLWTAQPTGTARLESPTSRSTALRLEGLPGDRFSIGVEVRAGSEVPLRALRAIVLDYPPKDLLAELAAGSKDWSSLGRDLEGRWRRWAEHGIDSVTSGSPCFRARAIPGNIWRVSGLLRPERQGDQPFAKTAVCLWLGATRFLACMCERDETGGKRWTASMQLVKLDRHRGSFTFRPLAPATVTVVDEGGKLPGAGYTITQRDGQLVFEIGFPGLGKTVEHKEPVRSEMQDAMLILYNGGSRAVFPKLVLW